MMKKYMIPTMDVVEVNNITLLAGSGGDGNGVSNTLSTDTPTGTTFHSREFSVWGASDEE